MAVTGAERMRRCREHQRAGLRRIVVRVPDAEIEDALIVAGLLPAARAADDNAVAAAAGQALAAWAKEQLLLAWARDVTRHGGEL